VPNQFADRSVAERLWERVDTSGGPNACWPWTGARFHFGHGAFKVNGRPWGAHRIAWELTNGPIADGQRILHICDNPPCCNPRHLYEGTLKDNGRDMRQRGRASHGETHPFARLDASSVRDARARFVAGNQIKDIAPEYGVSAGTLAKAIHGVTWAHVAGAIPVAHPHRRKRRYVRKAA
jgi:hypothetical protein